MTPAKQVEEQLQKEYEKFYNSTYLGKPPVPKNIMELFSKGIMAMPAFSHKINFTKVAGLVSKKSNELTVGDINDVVKVVMNTPIEKLFNSIEEAIPAIQKIERFVVSFNRDVEVFSNQLQAKRQTLLSLSGASSVPMSRIIN